MTRALSPFLIFVLFISFTFLSPSLYAQVLVDVSGRVTDDIGEPLPGATVYFEGTTIGASTDMDGYYTINNAEPGTYNLVAGFIGFESQTRFNIIIKSAGNQRYDFKLESSLTNLQEVVVTPDKNVVSRPKETPLSTQTLTAVELATYPGGNNDVVRVAQSLPGISPSAGGFRNDLIIRGGAPNETVYYLDDIEIPNINHFSTQGSSGGPVGMLNVSFIDDVTLSTSAFKAQYDNPLSGVLQFTQLTGDPKELNTNIRVSASETALTFNGPLFKGSKEQGKTTFIASARRSYLQFLFQLIGLPIRPDYWDYQFKVTHRLDDYNTLNLIGLGSIDDFSLEAPDGLDESARATFEQTPYIEQRSNTIGVSWKSRFKNRKGYMVSALSNNFLTNDFTRYTDNANREGIYFRNDARETETKLRHMQVYFMDDWKLSGGFNVQVSDYENNTLSTLGNFSYATQIDFLKYGLFANANRNYFKNRLNVNLGFRLDGDDFSTGSDFFSTFSPRASLSYGLNDQWKLNATAGRYFKIAPYTVLGYQENDAFVNQNSKYLRSDHLVLGIERLFGPSSSASIEGFYKFYEDYPVSVVDSVSLANKGAGFEVLGNEDVQSVGRGRSYGLEFLFQQKLSKNFYGILSYTYFVSEFTGFDRDVYRPSLWDSRHLISFTGGYKLKRNWEVSSRLRFAGRTPFVPTDLEATELSYPNIVLDFDRLGDETLVTFSQLDFRVDKKWNLEKLSIDLFLEIQNMLGRANPQAPEYVTLLDETGVEATPRTLVQLPGQEGAPIPSIGIVLDF